MVELCNPGSGVASADQVCCRPVQLGYDVYSCENVWRSRKNIELTLKLMSIIALREYLKFKNSIESAIAKFKMGTSWQPQSLRWGSNGTQNDPPVKTLLSRFWGDGKKKISSISHAMPCHVTDMFHWTKWNKMRPPLSPNHPGSCTYLERLRGQGRPVVHCDFAKATLLYISSLLTLSSNLRENTNQCNESTWCSC